MLSSQTQGLFLEVVVTFSSYFCLLGKAWRRQVHIDDIMATYCTSAVECTSLKLVRVHPLPHLHQNDAFWSTL